MAIICLLYTSRNKQIADQLCIAETTVNFHIKNLVDKLRAVSYTHLDVYKRQERRLALAEIGVELGIQANVAGVIQEEIQLDFNIAGAPQ